MPQGSRSQPRVIGDVTIHRRYRGLLAQDKTGNRVMIAWQPHGNNFLWHLGEQCQCRAGILQWLTVHKNALVLGCNSCSHSRRYLGIGVLASKRQVS